MSRSTFGAVAVALGLSAAAPASGQMQASWTEPFEPVQIADDLYWVGSAGLGAFLFTSEEGHVLIDAPLEENVPLVLENIRTLGFDPRDIRVHLATHAHFDHVAGMAALMRETGGELLVSEEDAPFLTSGADFGLDTDGWAPARVARTFGHLETIRLGEVELTAHLTPGHTPGCTSWSGTVTVGGEEHEFLLLCSLSALPTYRLAGPDPTYEGQAEDFCRSLAYVRSLEPDILLSNHDQMFGLADKAAARRAGDRLAFVRRGDLALLLEWAGPQIDRERQDDGLDPCPGSRRGLSPPRSMR